MRQPAAGRGAGERDRTADLPFTSSRDALVTLAPACPLYDRPKLTRGADNVLFYGDGYPDGSGDSKPRFRYLIAKADAHRAGRLAGHKPLLRRVLERLQPHRQEPGSEPHGPYGTSDDPGH
jgi:hypothetical protein